MFAAFLGQAYNFIQNALPEVVGRGGGRPQAATRLRVRARDTSPAQSIDGDQILSFRSELGSSSPQRRRIGVYVQSTIPRLTPFRVYRDLRRPITLNLNEPLYSQDAKPQERVVYQHRIWINEVALLNSTFNKCYLHCSGSILGRGNNYCRGRATCVLLTNEDGDIMQISEFNETKEHISDCIESETHVIHMKARQQLIYQLREYGGNPSDRYKEMIDLLKSEQITPEYYRCQRLYETFFSLQSMRSTLDR